jgi:hypothetical protein
MGTDVVEGGGSCVDAGGGERGGRGEGGEEEKERHGEGWGWHGGLGVGRWWVASIVSLGDRYMWLGKLVSYILAHWQWRLLYFLLADQQQRCIFC